MYHQAILATTIVTTFIHNHYQQTSNCHLALDLNLIDQERNGMQMENVAAVLFKIRMQEVV